MELIGKAETPELKLLKLAVRRLSITNPEESLTMKLKRLALTEDSQSKNIFPLLIRTRPKSLKKADASITESDSNRDIQKKKSSIVPLPRGIAYKSCRINASSTSRCFDEGKLMENRVANSNGTQNKKKSRSLDLKSLYEGKDNPNKLSNKPLKRKNGSDEEGGDEKGKKKKRSKKDGSVGESSKSINGERKKKGIDVGNGKVKLGSLDLKKGSGSGLGSESCMVEKVDSSSGLSSVPLELDGNIVCIPKRKRGFVGRKKSEATVGLKLVDETASKLDLEGGDGNSEDVELGERVDSPKVKQATHLDVAVDNNKSLVASAKTLKTASSNGGLLLEKSGKNHRKRKVVKTGDNAVKKAGPVVTVPVKADDDLQDDDEVNLEENAARMLSSRFDPSCTGFSSSGNKASALVSTRKSFLSSSVEKSSHKRSKTLDASNSSSADADNRVLRPRSLYKEKGLPRKRRHYYEIFPGEVDAQWVLNRRIKVYWPLDQSWYYGLVNAYDETRMLHHIKYDDRDEEWIDLKNERFKLLLLPGELLSKLGRKKHASVEKPFPKKQGEVEVKKDKRCLDVQGDSCNNIDLETEPIISWLARSSNRMKSSSSHSVNKRKKIGLSNNLNSPSLSNDLVDNSGDVDDVLLKQDRNMSPENGASLNRINDVGRAANALESSASCTESKAPVVYFRRRFRKANPYMKHNAEDGQTDLSQPESGSPVSPVANISGFLEESGICKKVNFERPLMFNDSLFVPDIILSVNRQCKIELAFVVYDVLRHSLSKENLPLCNGFLLLQHGVLAALWPTVNFEIIFVDNMFGLWSLSFRGCLKKAVAIALFVLQVFHSPNEEANGFSAQTPVTSIRFKFSYVQTSKKQLLFACCNFHTVKPSKWRRLESKLMEQGLLIEKLPLSECTYDNVQALQGGTKQLLHPCAHRSLVEDLPKRSSQGMNHSGTCRDHCYTNMPSSLNPNCKFGMLFPISPAFTAAPALVFSLHLKVLMDRTVSTISSPDHDSMETPQNSSSLVNNCSSMEDSLTRGLDFHGNVEAVLANTPQYNGFSCTKVDVRTGDLSGSSQAISKKLVEDHRNGDLHTAETCPASQNLDVETKEVEGLHNSKGSAVVLEEEPVPVVDREKDNLVCVAVSNGPTIEVPPSNQDETSVDKESCTTPHPADLAWKVNGDIVRSPNPTAPRSMWHRSRSVSAAGTILRGWADIKDSLYNGFSNGPKKRRTQVSYMLPTGTSDSGSKLSGPLQRMPPHKRIRRPNEKRSSDITRGSQRNLEELSCDVNVLITLGDKGWRVSGARVVLEVAGHNEWTLAVKILGSTKYSYKAHQFLQPGSTNRYTHAMMWKGGKDWTLEFLDRSQWHLFKEMHEECYNRNIRAASVKNIPIPGVQLIDDDDNGVESTFLRGPMYFQQDKSDVEMALDPSRILYDMDSDDEQWIRSSDVNDGNLNYSFVEIFEKTIDRLEKAAYARNHDQFTSEEIEKLMAGVGSLEALTAIHDYWQQKRQKKGMPLIRHLQPPLWERYQQQLKEWELAISKSNSAPDGSQRASVTEKPVMFAFCLKPRGLEVTNRGSKQRSQRKLSIAGTSNAAQVDHDGFHSLVSMRRLNGYAFGEERVLHPGHNYGYFDNSLLSRNSPREFSLASNGFDRYHHPRFHRNRSRNFGTLSSPRNLRTNVLDQGTVGWRGNSHHLNFAELPGPHNLQLERSRATAGLDGWNPDEFARRDAAGAAQHALYVARLKRERAQRLLCRADVSMHRAMAAIMIAEAVKAAEDDDSDD